MYGLKIVIFAIISVLFLTSIVNAELKCTYIGFLYGGGLLGYTETVGVSNESCKVCSEGCSGSNCAGSLIRTGSGTFTAPTTEGIYRYYACPGGLNATIKVSQRLPDLIITGMNLYGTTFTYTLKNNGTADIPSGTLIRSCLYRLYGGNAIAHQDITSGISAGGSVTNSFTTPVYCSSGLTSQRFQLMTDCAQQVIEINENNNELEKTISCPSSTTTTTTTITSTTTITTTTTTTTITSTTTTTTISAPPVPVSDVFYIKLFPGWNLISSPIENMTISDIEDDCKLIEYKGYKLWTMINGILEHSSELDPNKGYYVYSPALCTAIVRGVRAEFRTLGLSEGWNMISIKGRGLRDIIGSCGDKIVRYGGYEIWELTSNGWRHPGISEALNDSKGYLVYSNSRCELVAALPSATTTTTIANCHTKPLWDWSYCTSTCKCNAGEGDCDIDTECNTGYCAKDVGTKYGQSTDMDVCENRITTTTIQGGTTTTTSGGVTTTTAPAPPSSNCHTVPKWDWSYCTSTCKCNAGEGDCDIDTECNTGYCAKDVGTKYGQSTDMDVCENRITTTTSTLKSITTTTSSITATTLPKPDASLSVKLTDAETGKPLAGVKVVASCSPTGRTEATTNNSGMCTFNNLYAGSCWIDFYKDMYQNNETRVYLYKGSNTLAAYTSKITATINLLEPTPGGTVNPAPGVYKFRGGETAKFTALAKNGYEFDCWHKDYGTWGEIYYDSILSFNITGYNSYFRNLSAGFKCIMPALSPHNPPAQAKTPAPSGTNITIKRLRYAYSEVCNSGWQDVPINAPTGSKISLGLDWDASNSKVYMKNFNVKWFVKRPDGTVEEVPQVVMGYTYSGAGFVADQVGGYSVTAVLTGTPDGVNWYELGRKSG